MPERDEAEVRALIREIVLEVAPGQTDGAPENADLVEDLEYHSLALLELAFALEDEFDLPPIDEAAVQHIRTSVDIEDYVVGQLRANGALAAVAS